MTNLDTFVEKKMKEAMYHVIAWMEDEGDYQPTEEEAQEKVREIILAAVEHGREEAEFELKKLQEMTAFSEGKEEGRREVVEYIEEKVEEMTGASGDTPYPDLMETLKAARNL